MPLPDSDQKTRTIFKPGQPSIRSILLIWFLAFVLPILAGRTLITHFKKENERASKIEAMGKLYEEIEKFSRDCSIKSFIKDHLAKIEKHAELPDDSKNLKLMAGQAIKSEEKLGKLLEGFQKEFFCQPMLLVCAEEKEKNVQIFADEVKFPYFSKPGLRAAKAIIENLVALESYSHRARKDSPAKPSSLQERLLTNFSKSVFGSYFLPFEQETSVGEGFLDKGTGEKIFFLKRFWYSTEKRCLFSYFAVFAESSFPYESILKHAAMKSEKKSFSRGFCLKRARAFPFLVTEKCSILKLFRPAPLSILRAGSNAKKDIIRELFRKNLLPKKPAKVPFLMVSMPLERTAISRFETAFSLLAITSSFFCLFLMQRIHRQKAFKADIHSKMFLSVLLTAVLPASVFIYSCSSYISLQDKLETNELLRLMQNRLKLLELTIKSEDEFLAKQSLQLVEEIRAKNTAPGEEISQIFAKNLGGIFVAFALIRNDGLIAVKLDKERLLGKNSYSSFELSKKIVFATVYKFFQLTGLVRQSFEERVINARGGKELSAIANVLQPIDVDNLHAKEGTPYTTKSDSGNFRFITFGIQTKTAKKGIIASHFIVAQDVDELITRIIEKFADGWQTFSFNSPSGKIKTALISTFDANGAKPNFSNVWPVAEKLSPNLVSYANLIAKGKSELNSFFADKNGLKTAVTARKLAGYPLIAISYCSLANMDVRREKLNVAMLAIIVYLIAILSLFSSILSRLFISPIKSMLQAIVSMNKGETVLIQNSFQNEISAMTDEFNLMVKGMNERERLERFISEEATQTIEFESRQMTETKGIRVKRSIIFCHIKDFEKLTDSLPPENLIRLLNIYFSHMEKCIVNHQGQIDKYIGDAIMAGFSSETNAEISATNSCNAAIEMKKRLADINLALSEENLPQISAGFGVATGLVISGKIGSYNGRQDFTLIGDKVNLSARLEALSHDFTQDVILIDNETRNNLPKTFLAEFHGEIAVKGKSIPEKTYRLF